MSRATLEILVTLLSSFSLPLSFDERITLSYFQQPRRFTFTRNPKTLSRQFSLSLSFLFSLFLFVSRARCRFLCRHPYFSVAMKFRYEPLSTARSSGWIKEEETGLKETHNLAKEGIEKERERERDTKLERRGSWNLLEPSKRTKD